MRKLSNLLFIAALSGLFISSPAYAKKNTLVDATTKVVGSITSSEVNYNDLSQSLSRIEGKLKGGKMSSSEISLQVKQLYETRSKIIDAKDQTEKDLNFAQKRLEALGEAPKEGDIELEVISNRRKEFNDDLAYQKSRLAEADILLAKIDELDSMVIKVRNQKLLGSLLEPQEPFIYPSSFLNSTQLFAEFLIDIVRSPINWYEELDQEGHEFAKTSVIPAIIVFILCLWIGIYLRLFIMRHFGYNRELEHVRFSRKVTAAISVAIGYGVIPACILGGLATWMQQTKFMTEGFFGLVVLNLIYFTLFVLLARAFARVVFAPWNEKWRLIGFSNEKAKNVVYAFYFAIPVIVSADYLWFIAQKANYPLELISYLAALSSAVKAFCIILIAQRLTWDDTPQPENFDDEDEEDETGQDENISPSLKITFIVSLFAIGIFGLSLFGYPYLSAFIFNRLIISAITIGIFVMLQKSILEVLHRLLLLSFWVKTFRLRRKIVKKIDFWSSLLIDPILIILCLLCLLRIWGVSTDILIQTTVKLLNGFTIGGVKISLISIALGIIVFFISVAIVRSIKGKLMDNVLSKMDIDDGLKHSLAGGFGFFGFILAAMLGFAVMGGNLTNFALIAGALSFGVGLGLQNIVNNFVSGIILLFERPIKVGDWVIINGEEGLVKQINIRATELETWKRASIIIPNADLLSNTVTNLTHGDKWGRLDIVVNVAYGSNIDLVKSLLLEAADVNKRVLKKPSPYVIFKDFKESSLTFELRCYTADIMNGLGISSEMRFEINRLFINNKIGLPLPQQVVHFEEDLPDFSGKSSAKSSKKKEK